MIGMVLLYVDMESSIVARRKSCIFQLLKGKTIMSNNYPQDPSQQDQYGNQGNQYGNQGQQGQYGNQGNQNQYGNQGQQDQYGNQGNQGNQGQQDQYGNQGNQGQQGPLGDARQMAENQINQAIDQYGNKIPGGSQFTQQAKNAADGALNNLEQDAEKRMGNLGGLFGGNQNNQNQ